MTTGRHRTTGGESESESGTGARDTNVSVHSTSPERTVFTERDNTDGWIATDLTIELRL